MRAAKIIVKTAILNGGIYVKMGQGLGTMNHILPKEFYTTLRQLQNEALRSKGNDVNTNQLINQKTLIYNWFYLSNLDR